MSLALTHVSVSGSFHLIARCVKTEIGKAEWGSIFLAPLDDL